MFCKNCGYELQEGQKFCAKCGTEVTQNVENQEIYQEVEEEKTDTAGMNSDETMDDGNPVNAGTGQADDPQNNDLGSYCPKCGAQFREGALFCPKCGNRIGGEAGTDALQNYSLLDKVAIKFGNVLSIIGGIVCLILMRVLFGEGGFWGNAFGILFLLGGLGSIVSGVKDIISRKQKELTREELNKEKRNMCIGIPVIIIAVIVWVNSGGGVYTMVKDISFDSMGSETIGEIIEDNIKSPEWSKDKIDSNSYKVYVEGYSPLYDENIKITFYYEKDDDTYEVTLQGITFMDSGEDYDDALSAGIIWASFYDE